ncbi:hypothetical protein [Prevotella sp.]|uniref:hypothetical protein n=1 Tax=Prevotella sp. TaxID=59823 RepID=UPI002A81BA67|nr:hypothetical protein [Prevotella sp.]MDY4644664.1 hypothetical protein [Prevotella sp.]
MLLLCWRGGFGTSPSCGLLSFIRIAVHLLTPLATWFPLSIWFIDALCVSSLSVGESRPTAFCGFGYASLAIM